MSNMDSYDAGLLNDFGGGNVDWWQDYMRAELARADEFYQAQHADLMDAAPVSPAQAPLCYAAPTVFIRMMVQDTVLANLVKSREYCDDDYRPLYAAPVAQPAAPDQINTVMRKALERIAEPAGSNCGCSWPCQCRSQAAEALNAECMRDIAETALAKVPAAPVDDLTDARDADRIDFLDEYAAGEIQLRNGRLVMWGESSFSEYKTLRVAIDARIQP